MPVEFGSLTAFRKSLEHVTLNQFLTVYKSALCVNVCTIYVTVLYIQFVLELNSINK